MAADATSTSKTLTTLPARLDTNARNHWYAVAFLDDLPRPTSSLLGLKAPKPMGTSILGDPIVLWRDTSGQARCVADKCPHRSAPLSLGNVNGQSGNIECPYHGWQMDGCSGQVTHIPALMGGSSMPPNAKVRAYPVFEQDGVVYVWPGPPVAADTAPRPPRDETDSGLHLPDRASGFVQQRLCLDLPIDHCLMVENLLDPAHIPFAHEGTIGRRKAVKPLQMQIEETRDGFLGRHGHPGAFNGFAAPSNIVLCTPIKPGSMDMWQFVACTPTAPGQMRLVYRAYRNWATWVDRIPPLKTMFDGFSAKIIFQDYNLLIGQQQRLKERAMPWNSTIQVDCLPLLYRKYWKKTFGDTSRDGPWFSGWNGSMDVEDLDRLGTWEKEFDCAGCAIPKRPHHPLNSLEISGQPGNALRPFAPSQAMTKLRRILLVLAASAALAAWTRRYRR